MGNTPKSSLQFKKKIASSTSSINKLIMAIHEHINKRIKDFKCMSDTWRYGPELHVKAFYAVVSLTQIKLQYGEPMPEPYIK